MLRSGRFTVPAASAPFVAYFAIYLAIFLSVHSAPIATGRRSNCVPQRSTRWGSLCVAGMTIRAVWAAVVIASRSAVNNYLSSDVLPLLHGSQYRDSVRPDLFAAVAELKQLAGWMAYDMGEADSGRRHLRNAMHLCKDVGDDALAGEMLAGMSHQAAFLRSATLATDLARAAKDNAKRGGASAGL